MQILDSLEISPKRGSISQKNQKQIGGLQVNHLNGSSYQAAPELKKDSEFRYTKQCDIWAFGVLLYEMCTVYFGEEFQEPENLEYKTLSMGTR